MAIMTETGRGLEARSVEELTEMRAAADRELQTQLDSLATLRHVARRLEDGKVLVRNLAARGGSSEVLVPLSANLFVPGVLDTAAPLLVDVGAGYFAQLLPAAALRNADLDLSYVRQSIEAQSAALAQRQRLREQVQIQLRLRELRARSAPAKA